MEGEVPDEQSSDEAEKVNNSLEFLSFFFSFNSNILNSVYMWELL